MNLYRADGTIKTHYEYDSWGRVLSVTDENGNQITAKDNIGHVNPIRYRGYYYDTDTGLYYLKSRYYDPELGRFINADGYVSTGQGVLSTNMFGYCENSPINRADPTGKFWLTLLVTVAITVGIVATMASCEKPRKNTPAKVSSTRTPAKKTPQKSTTASKPKGTSFAVSELRICTDGASSSYGSSSHQSETAMSGRFGIATPADEIPYIVIPTNYSGYDDLIGCMGVVVNNQNGRYAYAIIGDGGPSVNGFGEVSLKAAWDLGFSPQEANGNCGPEGDFQIIIYPGTRQDWSANSLYSQIQSAGSRLYP